MQDETEGQEASQGQAEWSYNPDQKLSDLEADVRESPVAEPITWTASEFIAHEKSGSWYLILVIVTILAAGLTYVITRDYMSTTVVVVVTTCLGFYARHQPRQLEYGVKNEGIQIGARMYGYEMFKSFSVLEEGAIDSIQLTPLKRFMPAITIYFAPDDEDRIVDALGEHLPVEDAKHDAIDRLMRKIKF